MRRIIGWLALVALVAVAGWQGYAYWQRRQTALPVSATVPLPDSDSGPKGDIVTVDEPTATDPNLGATPMAQRVAVVGLLNKRNGESRDLTLAPGHAVRIGDVIVRLRACEQTAPYEQEQLTGAFVQLDVQQFDKSWRRVFSGWLYKERPSLNVVIHPVYDVWTKSCTMSFPDGGPESTSVAEPAPKPGASRAPKSAAATPSAGPSPTPLPPPLPPSPSADDNNPR